MRYLHRAGRQAERWIEGSDQEHGQQTCHQLSRDERERGRRCDAGEGIGKHACDRYRWVGKARRGGEPVGPPM
jgi:hypothetical protein